MLPRDDPSYDPRMDQLPPYDPPKKKGLPMKLWQWILMHAVVILIAATAGFALGLIINNQYR